MTDTTTQKRLVATLWLVAAGLAFIAVAIPYLSDRELNWGVAGGGMFCLIMGIATWSRRRQPPPPA